MRFGLSKTIITPPFPVKIACTGNFTDNYTAIHDDVYIRCLVTDDGKNKAVLMAFDLLFHSRDLNDNIAEYAKEKYGIAPAGVVVTYTHAHTAPAVKGYNYGHHNDEYEDFLVERAKECLDKAISSMFEGYLTYGSHKSELNVNRRRIENGVCTSAPNLAGERDTEMFIMCVRDTEDNVRGIMVNYACHPVFYPHMTTISAEFPGRVCQLLDTEYYGCVSIYTQSATGDVRPMDTVQINEDGTAGWKNDSSFSDIECFAKKMFAEVAAFISSGKLKKPGLSIESDKFELKADLVVSPKEEYEETYNRIKSRPTSPTTVNCERIINGLYETLPDYVMIHCSTVKLSDGLYIATIGGEPCYNVKKAVVSAFGDKDVCFIGYTDSSAYLVDDNILREGGYEPNSYREYGHKGRFKEGLNDLYRSGYTDSLKRINNR